MWQKALMWAAFGSQLRMIDGRPPVRSGNDFQGRLVTAIGFRFFQRLATIAFALSGACLLGSCGSGAVGDPGIVNDPTRITILPASGATLYSGNPTTFVVSGGTGSYIVSSGNQSVIPLSGSIRGNSFTVVPNAVAADTDVTLTVRDTGSTPLQTVTVKVKPGTVNNDVEITPSSTQGANCPSGTLCSGGDALVSVTLSQAGVPLAGRTVRFDAASGDYRFITSATGTVPEVLATTTFAVTDVAGRASVRIRATADAPNQTALIEVTDVSTGAFRRVPFTIAQSTGASPGFFATPSSYTFQGARTDQCASIAITPNLRATFYIFGGVPPYTITSPTTGLAVSRDFVSFSGGSFDVSPTGICVDNVPITVRDSAGHTTSVTVSNVRGTDAVPPLVVSPDSVTLSSCSSIAIVTAAGGTGHYVGNSGSGAITVGFAGGSSFFIQRKPESAASTSPVLAGISDGVSAVNVTVNLTGAGAGACSTGAFRADPTTVTLTSCTGTAQVTLFGGSGNYGFSTDNSAIKVTLTGNTLTIGRNPGAAAAANGGHVIATDGTSPSVTINVNDTTGVPCT
jgi:hypothetical protein